MFWDIEIVLYPVCRGDYQNLYTSKSHRTVYQRHNKTKQTNKKIPKNLKFKVLTTIN